MTLAATARAAVKHGGDITEAARCLQAFVAGESAEAGEPDRAWVGALLILDGLSGLARRG